MSVLKVFHRILSGPLFVTQNYGDYLWIVAYIALSVNPALNILYLSLGCAALYPFLMYYNLATATLITNPVLENASPELQAEVYDIAQQENASVALLKTVSNFSTLYMICGRFPSNAELFISTHFLEEKNTLLRRVFLHMSLKRLHATTKLILLNTVISTGMIAGLLLATKAAFIYLAGNTILKWSLIIFAIRMHSSMNGFLKAYINRKLTFALDKKIAQKLGAEIVITALHDFNVQTNLDNNLHDYPEWAVAIPKIASRIEALSITTAHTKN